MVSFVIRVLYHTIIRSNKPSFSTIQHSSQAKASEQQLFESVYV